MLLEQISSCKVEGEFVRRRTLLLNAFEDVDGWRAYPLARKEQRKFRRPFRRYVGQQQPILGKIGSGLSVAGLQVVGRQDE